jgi:hypothetical protein
MPEPGLPADLWLLFGDVGDTVLAEKEAGTLAGDPETEAVAVVVAYPALKPLAGEQHDCDLRARIDQGFQILGFGTCFLRIDRALHSRFPVEMIKLVFPDSIPVPVSISFFKMMPPGIFHKPVPFLV